MYIIGAILAFSILIIGHELGHFTLAKVNGVKVEEFSIGMGPKLFGVKGKETNYNVRILPIGGFVKMLGEEEKSNDPRSFSAKSPGRRLSIIAAGPLMNLILAILFFGIIAGARGFAIPTIDKFQPNSPAQIAGMQKGDEITKINNKNISTWEDFSTEIYTSGNSPLNLTVNRNGAIKDFKVVPIKDKVENRYVVGIYPATVSNPTIGQSVVYGFKETGSLAKQTLYFFKNLFKGKVSASDVGGPVTIIKVSGKAAQAGILSLTWFAAYLSIQLAIFNVIPFPALDGGWIFLLLFEIITGKKVNDDKVGVINYIGFALLMLLMVVVTIKDIFYPIKL